MSHQVGRLDQPIIQAMEAGVFIPHRGYTRLLQDSKLLHQQSREMLQVLRGGRHPVLRRDEPKVHQGNNKTEMN